MVGAVSGGQGLGSAMSLYRAEQTQGVAGLTASQSLQRAAPAGQGAQSSAAISAAGKLLSNLQQLQMQNPAKFKQVVSQIASQLQTAAQQTQGPQSDLLSNLAAKFQSVANGGSLSQLQPGQLQHHHHRAQQAYGQGAQLQPQTAAGLTQLSGSQPPSSPTLQQLFTTISTQALAG
jgi:hypothetical protein